MHMLFAYLSYENSGSIRSFYTVYGIWIVISGAILITFISLIIGSANDIICDEYSFFFTIAHRVLGFLFIALLAFHGSSDNVIGQYYLFFVGAPLFFYIFDILYRFARADI